MTTLPPNLTGLLPLLLLLLAFVAIGLLGCGGDSPPPPWQGWAITATSLSPDGPRTLASPSTVTGTCEFNAAQSLFVLQLTVNGRPYFAEGTFTRMGKLDQYLLCPDGPAQPNFQLFNLAPGQSYLRAATPADCPFYPSLLWLTKQPAF